MSGDLKTVTSKSRYFTVNRITLIAVLTAFVTVGRLIFALPILPNIQPMTAMLIIITLNIGVIDGITVSVFSVILTNIFLGMGIWSIMQIISFVVIMVLTVVLKYFYKYGGLRNRIIFSIWAGITGFTYGFTISLMSYYTYGLSNFTVYYLNGIPFDILHAVGNLIFFFILEPIIVPIIQKKFKHQNQS
ncbi:ECF transporter S component [Fundicoccus culcitae]|uniref:ECF transporter S component n=1 Tax=Fundicoccus culcitae TaxID=2969821 RepID=A0ABY5P4N5_9LACT|nr:ECF transporter S component [Fundicoccus culcitae]UUX33509.1 ECF transporter S component [Fundicoccus culcitae]